MPQPIPPPHTPQADAVGAGLPTHSAYNATPATGAPTPAGAAPKTTPTKSTLKALPTVRDHTTDQLNETGDEYIPREYDEFGEKKVMQNGQLQGGRTYRCRTFLVPNRGDKLFMLATECARVLGYRDSYLLFNKNRSLYKIIASQPEKDDLVSQEILPFSYRSRQIAIVTARSMFRQFGSRVIEGGRRVRDDYWEQKARKQGFTEADLAGEKRPGAAKAREAAAEAQNAILPPGPHTEIVYNNNPAAYPGPPQPPLVQPDLADARPRDYSGIIKGGPRQEITGPPYQDQTRPSPLGEVQSQASHAADFNRSVNQQRGMRNEYLQDIWRRPHEQPPTSLGSSDPVVPSTAGRPNTSPHATTAASGISQPPVVSSQSPQMMMTGPPYSQSIQAQSTPGHQPPLRGKAATATPASSLPDMAPTTLLPKGILPALNANRLVTAGSTSSIGQGTPGYNYQSGQMWSQTPQTPQHSYGSYSGAQAQAQAQQQQQQQQQQQPSHPSQSPASHLRQPSSGQMQPGSMQFPSMGGMQYGAAGGTMYPAEQTPRQYMPQTAPGSAQWSSQHPPPQQWWAPQQQPQ
ncbi:chromatin structure-remodeling complex protein RSC7 [Geosmithia morbida]|uniref:Chromatin structure-remodeling complex protein RSC7 n=1 Tax=Geosmithia morbida TaxID=1094350 RepID=A0A9P4YP45_9HYPO|nr:chromatin structure-remodeling complex protein RSC7 [Geosmithia morbida]KAF4119227.1 chromatin structure-remodeling complex protein RSC7 [Geosmithia morbida]